jgi:hypothetical protein
VSAADDLAELKADVAIRAVLNRYCRAIDRLDEDALRSCYHLDAREDRPGFHGDVNEFVAWSFGELANFDRTTHYSSNYLADVAGDRAAVESAALAYHFVEDAPEQSLVLGFRYLDQFENRPGAGGWRIARRRGVLEWRFQFENGPQLQRLGRSSRRDRRDPSYELLDALQATAQDHRSTSGA